MVNSIDRVELQVLLERYGMELRLVAPDEVIPGSYWGEREAGLIGTNLYARLDTPIHSVLHEAAHFVCMTAERRAGLDTDAGGDTAEENAVCYLQILWAEVLPNVGRDRICRDMDAWGYTFRLGSASRWFHEDAADAAKWLQQHGVADATGSLSMPAGEYSIVSRRGVLTTLATLIAAGCSRAAFLAVNLPAAFGPYKRYTDIEYGAGSAQSLDVYVPEKPAAGARPLFVFWHGGRWTFGDKQDYRFVGAALAEQGYVVVIPNYRHYPQVKMPGFMADAARAALWAVAHAADYGADPQQLYLMGHSAGAHMAALLALDSSHFAAVGQTVPRVRGVVGLSGPYDFLPFTDDDMRDMFGPVENYPLSQPINFVRDEAPPMLLVHGLKDDTVWPKNTRNLASALSARDVRVTLKFYPKLVHADTVAALSSTVRGRAPTLADIVYFVTNNEA